MLSETNKLIKVLMEEDSPLFPSYTLFANGIGSFEDVLRNAEDSGIEFPEYVRSKGLDYEKIKIGD